jgi:hypothetical protein
MAVPNWFRVSTMVSMLLCVASACAPIAAIQRRSGPPIVGKIDRSDAERLYVTEPNGARYAVERRDVVDIDHPGGAPIVIGSICGGAGLGTLAIAPLFRDPADNLFYAIGIGYLACAIPVFLAGIGVWHRSHQAAEPPPVSLRPIRATGPSLEGAP